MKISQLIAQLQDLHSESGDIEIKIRMGGVDADFDIMVEDDEDDEDGQQAQDRIHPDVLELLERAGGLCTDEDGEPLIPVLAGSQIQEFADLLLDWRESIGKLAVPVLTESDIAEGYRESNRLLSFRDMNAWQVWLRACLWREAYHLKVCEG